MNVITSPRHSRGHAISQRDTESKYSTIRHNTTTTKITKKNAIQHKKQSPKAKPGGKSITSVEEKQNTRKSLSTRRKKQSQQAKSGSKIGRSKAAKAKAPKQIRRQKHKHDISRRKAKGKKILATTNLGKLCVML